MGKSSPPAPPDPRDTAAAQTGTNVATAITNSMTGLVDQYTPQGSLTYDISDTYTFDDPFTGETYDVPRFTATTQLTPEQQAIMDSNLQAQGSLSELASDRASFLRDYLPQSEALTDQIGNRLYDMGSQRLDSRFQQQRDSLQTRLANQGIAPGSEAYNREMQQMGQSENDAYNQLMLQGRGQAMSEINAPINQITALLSGSQVSNPNVQMQQPAQMPTTDVAGLINTNYNQRLGAYNQQASQRGSLMGGLFGAGATLLGAPSGSLIGGLF